MSNRRNVERAATLDLSGLRPEAVIMLRACVEGLREGYKRLDEEGFCKEGGEREVLQTLRDSLRMIATLPSRLLVEQDEDISTKALVEKEVERYYGPEAGKDKKGGKADEKGKKKGKMGRRGRTPARGSSPSNCVAGLEDHMREREEYQEAMRRIDEEQRKERRREAERKSQRKGNSADTRRCPSTCEGSN